MASYLTELDLLSVLWLLSKLEIDFMLYLFIDVFSMSDEATLSRPSA